MTHEIITFQAICMDKILKDFTSIKDTYYAALTLDNSFENLEFVNIRQKKSDLKFWREK